jgi:hypothetical protein
MKVFTIAHRILLFGTLLKNCKGTTSTSQNRNTNTTTARGMPQVSTLTTMIDVSFTMVYNPVGGNLEASDFSTAAELSCAHVEKFVKDVFALASTIIVLVNVFCSPVTTVFNTNIGYKMSVLIGEGSKVIPSQADIQTLVCASLSSDEIEPLDLILPNTLSISAIPCDQALTPITNQINAYVQPTSVPTPTYYPTLHPTNVVTNPPTHIPSPGPTQEPSHFPTTGALIQAAFTSRFSNVSGIPIAADQKIVVESICLQVVGFLKGTFELMGTAIVLEKLICSQLDTKRSALEVVEFEIYLIIGKESAIVPNQEDVASLVCFSVSTTNLPSLLQSFPTNNPFSSATSVTCDQNQR